MGNLVKSSNNNLIKRNSSLFSNISGDGCCCGGGGGGNYCNSFCDPPLANIYNIVADWHFPGGENIHIEYNVENDNISCCWFGKLDGNDCGSTQCAILCWTSEDIYYPPESENLVVLADSWYVHGFAALFLVGGSTDPCDPAGVYSDNDGNTATVS